MSQISALLIALVSSLILTPNFIRFALRVGLVDHPDPTRKLHGRPVAISGGVAVLGAFLLASVAAISFSSSLTSSFLASGVASVGLFVCAILVVVLGVVDDYWTLRGRQKLLGQILICSLLVLCGYQMKTVSLFGWDFHLGALAIPFSIGWLLLTTNALNLIDGADGLCSSVGWIAAAGIAAMASLGSHQLESVLAAALSGALLGFLVFNFPPARVFLGDAGSMVIGLLLGALALRTSLKEATAVSMFLPVTVLAIPLFDSSMAILRRKLTGRSIFAVDRGHLHHNLLRRGYTNSGLVIVVTLLCSFVAVGAFLGMWLSNDMIAFFSMALALGGLVATRLFGFAEMTLLFNRTMHFAASLLARNGKSDNYVRQQMVRLQGCRAWDSIWDAMTHFAETNDLAKVCMDLNVPWLHEGFHASWQRNKLPEIAARWHVRLPVISNGRLLGRLEVVGKSNNSDHLQVMTRLVGLLESLQPDIALLASEHPLNIETPSLAGDSNVTGIAGGKVVTNG